MKIGIIGAGAIGGTLARKFAAADHVVKIAASKGPDEIQELASEIGAEAVDSRDAVKDVDVVVVAVPYISIPALTSIIGGVSPEITVIDTSNYYPFRDGEISGLDGEKTESVWVIEQFGRPVIKAFNAVLAHTLATAGQPSGGAGRIALPVAGDSETGKKVASELMDVAGFDAVDAGSLAESWRQQPGTPAYCTELTVDELRVALASADKARAPENREALIGEFFELGAALTHEVAIARNRAVTAAK